MIALKTNLDRTTTTAHPRNAGFATLQSRTLLAGLSEFRIKF